MWLNKQLINPKLPQSFIINVDPILDFWTLWQWAAKPVFTLHMQAVSMARGRREVLAMQQRAFLKFNLFPDILASTPHCCQICFSNTKAVKQKPESNIQWCPQFQKFEWLHATTRDSKKLCAAPLP